MAWSRAADEALLALERARLRAYVVGGAVRDQLLGRPVRDVDLFVDADAAAVQRALPAAIRIDGANPILLLRASGEHAEVEITTPRSGSQGLYEDLERRDFTINAMAIEGGAGARVDPTGGFDDLKARRLRSPRPERAFPEDPVRVLRGARLATELEFVIDAPTRLEMQRSSHRLVGAPGERLGAEIERLLELERPASGIEQLRDLGALAAVLPELLRLVGVAQNRHHREGDDVYTHTLRVCDATPARAVPRLAALLHDAAKPESKAWSAKHGDYTFLRHDLLARPHVRRVAQRLRLSRRKRDAIERLVRHHLLYASQLETDAALRRMVRRAGADILDDLLALRRADLASRAPDGRPPIDWLEVEGRVSALVRSEPAMPLAIGGEDVMRCLGITEGPVVGRWLRRARRRIELHPEENEAPRLLEWIRRTRESEERETEGP